MFLDKIEKTIKKFCLISRRDKVIVGVSGGPDSVALLLALNSIKNKLNLSLHVAHLDHMLRADSKKDAIFVKRLAQKLRLPVTSERIDVKAAARDSVEQAARIARLEFLFSVARKNGAKKIALGHNLDDQAETVIMRILRGSGLYGLSAIQAKRNISGFEIIRPLIETKRREIEVFLKKRRIKACVDESNFDEVYLRNKIRHKLLPLLEKEYCSNIVEALGNLAHTVASDYDYLKKQAKKAEKKLGTNINLKKLLRLHPALQRLILRMSIERLKGNTRRISLQHTREIEDLIRNRPDNSIVDLPQGVSVIKKAKTLSFFNR